MSAPLPDTSAYPSPAMPLWRAWMAAVRPASLPLAVAPVLAGGAVAYHRQGTVPTGLLLLALLAALLMQVVTNLQNDVGFTARGAHRLGRRVGLPRATAQGWLSVAAVRRAVWACALVGLLLGLVLAAWRGWPVLALGGLSLLAALAYMGGPRPIAYTGFGELTVFVFFGGVAVLGTEWLLSDRVSRLGVVAAVLVGAVSAAALVVNNHRDMAHDRLVGRRTLAVRWGAQRSKQLFAVLLLLPFLATAGLAWLTGSVWTLLPCLVLPRAWSLWRHFLFVPPGPAYNEVLQGVFRLGLWLALWMGVGLLLAR